MTTGRPSCPGPTCCYHDVTSVPLNGHGGEGTVRQIAGEKAPLSSPGTSENHFKFEKELR